MVISLNLLPLPPLWQTASTEAKGTIALRRNANIVSAWPSLFSLKDVPIHIQIRYIASIFTCFAPHRSFLSRLTEKITPCLRACTPTQLLIPDKRVNGFQARGRKESEVSIQLWY